LSLPDTWRACFGFLLLFVHSYPGSAVCRSAVYQLHIELLPVLYLLLKYTTTWPYPKVYPYP